MVRSLNANNLAGYLTFGILSGIGLLVLREPPLPRWCIGLGLATALGAVVLSASRSGVIGLGLGVISMPIALWFTRRRGQRSDLAERRTVRWLLGGVLLGGAALAVLGASATPGSSSPIATCTRSERSVGHNRW